MARILRKRSYLQLANGVEGRGILEFIEVPSHLVMVFEVDLKLPKITTAHIVVGFDADWGDNCSGVDVLQISTLSIVGGSAYLCVT